jgi:hypothetical protein
VTRKLEKIAKILGKVTKTVAKPQDAKISAQKLNLKVPSIFLKPLLKPKNTFNKPYFETVYSVACTIKLLGS